MSGVRVEAPAKVNLFLEVVGRRSDGFHELETVFAALKLCDVLEVESTEDGALALEVEGDAGGAVGADNLVVRAAEALRAAWDGLSPQAGARLRLRKQIPAGGGLGGGSSDAAATLRALAESWRSQADTPAPELLPLAAALGSDVPFFLEGGLQLGRGRGEVLAPLAPPTFELWVTPVLPGFPCATPEVFRAYHQETGRGARRPVEPMLEALGAQEAGACVEAAFNRLEKPACARYPAVKDLLKRLRREGSPCLLSGSGSTVFWLSADAEHASWLADRARTLGLTTPGATTLDLDSRA